METKPEPRIEFGRGHTLAIAALIAGVMIAVGLPAVVLGLGHNLTGQMQLWLVVLAVSFGGLTALTAAFFGSVMPTSVGGKWGECCEHRRSREPTTDTAKQ